MTSYESDTIPLRNLVTCPWTMLSRELIGSRAGNPTASRPSAVARWTGFSDLPRAEVVFIGLTEVLGAIGLLLPMATGILPWLTPVAALGLAVIVLMAAGFHLRANEYLPALETALWASISVVVAIGRWDLIAARQRPGVGPRRRPAVLVPAAVINVIILLRRPAPSLVKRPVRRALT